MPSPEREANPFATTPLGKLALGADDAELTGYLLVCGRGRVSLDLEIFPPAVLANKSGEDWELRFRACLFRRVFSNSQCVQFFQVLMMACEGRFFTFLPSPPEDCGPQPTFGSSASPVVTKCSVEPLDRALRMTPSFGGGIGFLCRLVLADLIESLSIGGGGTSLSAGLCGPLPRSSRSGVVGIVKLG